MLIIDDFGLKPLRAPADEDLHDLIAERYERAATLVTSNLDFTEWDQIFPGNRLLASATVDRLRHNAYCLTLDGASYRAPRQGSNRAKNALASTPKNIDSCPPQRRPSEPGSSGFYMPIIGGSIVAVSDNTHAFTSRKADKADESMPPGSCQIPLLASPHAKPPARPCASIGRYSSGMAGGASRESNGLTRRR